MEGPGPAPMEWRSSVRCAMPDVLDWTYTGDKLHPTQKSIHVLKPLIEEFTAPGQLVLDPFAGSGSERVAAKRTGRDYIGIELDAMHHATACKPASDSQNRTDANPDPRCATPARVFGAAGKIGWTRIR
jgi:hypothetical protein